MGMNTSGAKASAMGMNAEVANLELAISSVKYPFNADINTRTTMHCVYWHVETPQQFIVNHFSKAVLKVQCTGVFSY
jgi:hypothetical protein